jgi:hypothetical protein
MMWLPDANCLGRVASDAQAIFFRRRHQPKRPTLAKIIRPGSPAPARGPGTAATVVGTRKKLSGLPTAPVKFTRVCAREAR